MSFQNFLTRIPLGIVSWKDLEVLPLCPQLATSSLCLRQSFPETIPQNDCSTKSA